MNMKKVISAYIVKVGRLLPAAILACAASAALSSCDSAIYDDEGDCSVNYRVEFRYDRNMKWADAFAREVGSVHLYAFDAAGILVWQQAERGDALAADGYAMTLGLPAGDYHLVAWCGLENDGEREESFSVPEMRVGESRLSQLQCALRRDRDASGAFCSGHLYPLFHGMLDVTLPANDDGADYTYTMDLTKDTNHVRVILQQLSGEPVDVDDFSFRIEEENGLMASDNSLLPDEMITYRAYSTTSGSAGLGIDDYPELTKGTPRHAPDAADTRTTVTSVSVAIADIDIARLVAGRPTYLIIESDGADRPVARIPLADYALLLKGGYGADMSDQDYLDRQDEYSLTFFLDESRCWIGSSIIINSWKIVLQNLDF